MEKCGFTGPVTALSYITPAILLSGQGSYLKVYLDFRLLSSILVPHTVLGITTNEDFGVAWGGSKFSKFHLQDPVHLLSSYQSSDWIWDFRILTDVFVVASAHNFLEIKEKESGNTISIVQGSTHCLMYSVQLYGASLADLLIASGTQFKSIFLWSQLGTFRVLEGHSGVVFRIRFNEAGSHLLSVSDDRSIKLWDVHSNICNLTLFGHSARIWDACFLQELTFFGSVGEDCTLRIWNRDKCVNVITAHSGRNVWSLAASLDRSILATGGQDGLIKQWTVSDLIQKPEICSQIHSVVEDLSWDLPMIDPAHVQEEAIHALAMDQNYVYIGTTDGQLFRVHRTMESWILFLTLPDTITALVANKGMVVAGDSKGLVWFIETDSGKVQATHPGSELRVCNLFALTHETYDLASADPSGKIVLWSHTEPVLRLSIPEQERVFSATISIDRFYCGDALGSLYVFQLGPNPELIQWVRHLHKRCRLTSICIREEDLYTTGRDGKIHHFVVTTTGLEHTGFKTVGDYSIIEKVCPESKLALVFHKSKACIYHSGTDYLLFSVDCKGSRRPYVFETTPGRVSLCYSLRASVAIHNIPVPFMEATDINNEARVSGVAGHGREVLSITHVTLMDREILITGGEDNFIKIFEISAEGGVQLLDTIVGHPAGVRAVSVFKQTESIAVLLSGGGKMMVFLWEIKSDGATIKVRKLTSVKLPGEVDQRVMCVDIDQYWAVTGDSGGTVSLFHQEAKGSGLLLHFDGKVELGTSSLSVILCMTLLHLQECCFLAIGTASGMLNVCRLPGGVLVAQVKAHQFGVNCMTTQALDPSHFLLITGGDDQSISIHSFAYPNTLLQTAHQTLAHTSAIKGIYVHDASLVSVSWDQYIRLWDVSSFALRETCLHTVGDCSGVTCTPRFAVVAGVGIEWFRLK